MKRLAPVLAAAVLLAGCAVTDESGVVVEKRYCWTKNYPYPCQYATQRWLKVRADRDGEEHWVTVGREVYEETAEGDRWADPDAERIDR